MTAAPDLGPDPGDGLGVAAVAAIRERADLAASVGVLCGSGLGGSLSGVRGELRDEVDIVGEAENTTDAIAGIVETEPDVVLLDVHLPEGRGPR